MLNCLHSRKRTFLYMGFCLLITRDSFQLLGNGKWTHFCCLRWCGKWKHNGQATPFKRACENWFIHYVLLFFTMVKQVIAVHDHHHLLFALFTHWGKTVIPWKNLSLISSSGQENSLNWTIFYSITPPHSRQEP